MSTENQVLFNEIFTKELRQKVVIKNDSKKTFELLSEEYYSSSNNIFYLIINSRESPLRHLFGIEKLSEIEVSQEGTSDMVLISYESSDPGVTFKTINIAIEVLLTKVKMIKSAESNSVVKYFETEVIKAQNKLNKEERELAKLMTQNNITNYYEQTKWLASRNEDFEVAFQKEKLGLAAAEAAEKEAIAAMGISSNIKMMKDKILNQRKVIRGLNKQKEENTIFNDFLLAPQRGKDSLHSEDNDKYEIDKQLRQKEEELNNLIAGLLEMKNTASGVQIEDVALKWLESIIKVEEYKARIIQFILFEKEFEKSYSRFAKLGSKIKQLERRIGVYERDYLDFVASLNDARLNEENIQMSSSLKIIDKPFYPLDPEKSKKLLIVTVSSLVGLIFFLGILIVLEYLDESIKTPKRLAKLSETELIGGYPIIEPEQTKESKSLHTKLIKQVATFINHRYYENENRPEPFIVMIFSTRIKEGKSKISQLVAKELRSSGENTLVINTTSDKNKLINNENPDSITHLQPTNIYDLDIESIIKNQSPTVKSKKYRYILVETPSLIGNDIPIKMIKDAHLSLMVSKATRVWNKADSMVLNTYKSIISHSIGSIINGTVVDELETIIGEIPKERSDLRKKIKKLAKFQFRTNKF